MQIKFADVIAVGAFIGWYFSVKKNKTLTWIFGVTCALALLVMIFGPSEAKQPAAVVSQSATNSQQAVGGATNSPAANIKGNSNQVIQDSPSTVAPQINVSGPNSGIIALQINPFLSPVTQTTIVTNTAPGRRRITEAQMDQFKLILTNAHKTPAWVIYGNQSSETIHFTSQVRKMLDDAGYSVMAKPFNSKPPSALVFLDNGGTANIPGMNVGYDTSATIALGVSALDSSVQPIITDLRDAFKAIGMGVDICQIPDNMIEKGQVDVIVYDNGY